MMRTFFFLFFAFITFQSAKCQIDQSINKEDWINFSRYLITKHKYNDALAALDLLSITDYNPEVNFLKGLSWMKLHRHDSANHYFFNVISRKQNDSIYYRSLYYYNHSSIILQNDLIIPLVEEDQRQAELFRLQKLALNLVRRDFATFDEIFNSDKCKIAELAMIEFNLYLYCNELKNIKQRSQFIAGLLSSIIPGVGKLYAGKPHEAINSFLPVAFNYAQAVEGYLKKDVKSPHLYIFGSIGTVFYVSNIYGSAKAVKRRYKEKIQTTEMKITHELDKLLLIY